MLDTEKQVEYWTTLSRRDIETAGILIAADRPLEAMFFSHMAIEKALKARIVRNTDRTPPRVHNLTRLAAESGPGIDEQTLDFLAEMNRFSVHGRYPLSIDYRPTADEMARYWPRAREVLDCLLPRSSPS